MPPNDDNGLTHELYKTLVEVSERMTRLQADVSEAVAQQLRSYREDVHRTTMGIHLRLLGYEDGLTRDRKDREARQAELDARQQAIDAKLTAIQRNQRIWLRVVVALALIAVGVVLAWWLL